MEEIYKSKSDENARKMRKAEILSTLYSKTGLSYNQPKLLWKSVETDALDVSKVFVSSFLCFLGGHDLNPPPEAKRHLTIKQV